MESIIVITGPTGVGKTSLSISLAKRYDAEIINADSMQVYRHLNIGTAKVKKEEMANIPHHLFDIKDIDEEYTIYHYQRDLRNKMKEISARNKRIIIVGGTPLYLKAGLFDYTLEDTKTKRDLSNYTTLELVAKLKEIDGNLKIDFHNRRRVERAYNFYLDNKKSISTNNKGNNLLYDVIFIGLTTNREELYQRINMRVDDMIREGLFQEVKDLYDKGYRTKPLLNGIGYKEIYKYYDNECSYEEAVEQIKQNSRKYAKRQYTFLKNKFNIKWFTVHYDNFNETIKEVCDYIDNYKVGEK